MQVKMLVVQGRPAGKILIFPDGEYYFGRGTECHVRPNSEWVSRQHCLLRVTSSAGFLRDLGSRNGTLVNGALLNEERLLKHGDQVQLGPLVFEVQYDSDVVTRGEEGAMPPPGIDLVSSGTIPALTEFSPSLASTEPVPIQPSQSGKTKG